jgi:signal transduction histidine kinase
MRLHGGDLEISSKLGKGTTIALAFPEDCVLRQPSVMARPGIAAAGE